MTSDTFITSWENTVQQPQGLKWSDHPGKYQPGLGGDFASLRHNGPLTNLVTGP